MSYSNINRVVLVGNLTRDPELRALSSGGSVCSLRIACTGLRKDANGDYEDRPNFFTVSVFGTQAENVDRYLNKGDRVGVDGRLRWHEWETEDKQRRETVEVVADAVEFLQGPGQQDGAPDGSGFDGQGGELVGAGASSTEIPF
ncbi:MAG TPA: single-stranded DNA-binding protein [Solirubrobacteraceae bacterium]|jgi:single-strand DNA-binding protein